MVATSLKKKTKTAFVAMTELVSGTGTSARQFTEMSAGQVIPGGPITVIFVDAISFVPPRSTVHCKVNAPPEMDVTSTVALFAGPTMLALAVFGRFVLMLQV